MRFKSLLLTASTFTALSLAAATTMAADMDMEFDIDEEFDDCRSDIALNVAGQVNRGVLYAENSEVDDIFFVDNDHSSTRVRFDAIGRIDCDWQVGAQIEVQFESNSSAAIRFEQGGDPGPNNFTERKLEVWFDNRTFGRIWLGQGSMASDGTSEVDLSGTDVVGYASVADMAGGLEFENGVRISSVSDNFDGQSRRDRIRYDSPTIAGFRLSSSYSDRDRWDVALRFAERFGGVQVSTAVAFSDDGANSEAEYRIDGSASILFDFGLNFTVAAGMDENAEDGRDNAVRDPYFVYGKVGWIFDVFDFGSTAVAVDYQMTRNLDAQDDEFESYGAFFVQRIDHVGTEFYAGVRLHELNATPVGLPVAGTNFTATADDSPANVLAVTTGARVKF